MKEQKEFNWTTSSNENIYAYHWEIDEPKAVICLVHGLGEHLHRYQQMAAYYNDNGYAIMSFDNIGHGKSGGARGHTPSFKIYMENIDNLVAAAEKEYPLLPKFIYGHSMGGNLVLNYCLKNNPKIAGLITTGAWILLPKKPPALQVGIGKVLRNIFPSVLQSNKLDPSLVSRSKEVVQQYINDPLVHDKISLNAGIEMLNAANWLASYQGHNDMPILLMHGKEDVITSPRGSELLAESLTGDVLHAEWDGLYHEIHNEPEKTEVFDFTIKWIEEKIVKWKESAKEV